MVRANMERISYIFCCMYERVYVLKALRKNKVFNSIIDVFSVLVNSSERVTSVRACVCVCSERGREKGARG